MTHCHFSPSVDGLDILGPVQVGLVGGQDGEGAAHHSYGGHRRGAEPAHKFGIRIWRQNLIFKKSGRLFESKFPEDCLNSHGEVEWRHGPVRRRDALRDGVGD